MRWQAAKNYFVKSVECGLMGKTLVSWCRWSWVDMRREPVATLRAWFRTICRSSNLDLLMVQTGAAYTNLTIDLYVNNKVSLSWPQVDPARAFIMFTFVLALLTVFFGMFAEGVHCA